MTGCIARTRQADSLLNLSIADLYRSRGTLAILEIAIRAVETKEKACLNGHDTKKEILFVYGAAGFPIIGRSAGEKRMPKASESAARR